MSGSSPTARIEQLDEIQKDVIAILQNASSALTELGKDRPSQKAADNYVTAVMSNIKSVDNKLNDQIKYLTQVSTGHPHEGSSYPSQKILQTAWHRLEHARSRVNELEKLSGNITGASGGLSQAPGPVLIVAHLDLVQVFVLAQSSSSLYHIHSSLHPLDGLKVPEKCSMGV